MTSLNSAETDNAPSESMAAEERLATPKVVKIFGAQPFLVGWVLLWNMQILHSMV